ncbi:MAG: phosphoglycerate kinase [Candidatus Thalassarchaeaceae archaeon]|nr:phosphoglycerate kinase [Candidatus Thalassarchaeaceae archaeon]
MTSFQTLDDADLVGKTVLVRVDVNSPLNPVTNEFLDDSRLRAIMPTLRRLGSSKVVLLSHQSRPGKSDFTSMERHAELMGVLLGRIVKFVPDICGDVALTAIREMNNGDMLFLDNVRGWDEEISMKKASLDELGASEIVQKLSSVADIFVYDAFACAHRNSPTISGFGSVLPSYAGILIQNEIEALNFAVINPPRPYTVILGGIKCDDSLDIACNLLKREIVDNIVPVGIVGNLMLWASGIDLGNTNQSFIQDSLGDAFERTWEMATWIVKNHQDKLILPTDLAIEVEEERVAILVQDLPTEYPIYDLGIDTLMKISPVIMNAKCILWNGPASYFEKPKFAFGTIEILNTCVETDAFVIVGGGHTGTLVNQRGAGEKVGHNSTGGGSCLTFLAGKRMPAIEALEKSAQKFT